MGVGLFHGDGRADGRTDMTKLIVAFHNLANAPKKTGWWINNWVLTKLCLASSGFKTETALNDVHA